MTKIKSYIVIFICIGSLIYLSKAFFKNSQKYPTILQEYNLTPDQYNKINEKDKIALNSTKKEHLDNLSIYDLEDKKYSLKSILTGKPKMILKFSSLQCSYCIDHIMDYIRKYKDTIGLKNIVILGEFINKHDFSTFKRLNDINLEIFNIYKGNLGLPADDLNIPYIVVTDSSLNPKKVFVPLKEIPIRTDKYFKTVMIKCFKNY